MTKPGRDYFLNIGSNLRVESVSLGDEHEWSAAVNGVAHSIFQTWAYCTAIQKSQTGALEMLSMRTSNSGLVAIFVRRSKNGVDYDIYSPYGLGGLLLWGGECRVIWEAFETWMQENRIVTAFLMAHPGFESQKDEHFVRFRSSYLLDLSTSEENLWTNLAISHKQELRKLLEDRRITITENKADIMKIFPRLYEDTLTRVGAGSAYFFTEGTLSELVNGTNSVVLGGKVNGVIRAVVLIVYSNSCAEYFINAADLEGRHLTRLLLWIAIKRLQSLRIPKFNLGGGVTEGDALEAFKKRFGGEKVLIPVYRKVVDVDRYSSLCEEYGVDANDSGYFPPYWKLNK